MPALVMLIGLPASGKSTFRSLYVQAYPDHIVVSSDDYIDNYAKNVGKTYNDVFRDVVKDADRICRAQFADAISKGENIIVDRTNMSAKSRRTYLSQVPPGYTRIGMLFEIDPDALQARLDARFASSGKGIPKSVITSMRASFDMPSSEEFQIVTRIIQ